MRAPSSSDADAVSNNDAIVNNFELFNDNLRSSLYNLLVSYENFDLFGTEARYIANTSQYSSIESIHDSVHAMVGAQVIDPTYIYGHMSYLPYSAFDPAFMLHHAMVDRAVAMWQVLYPNDYLTPEPAVFPTYTIPVGQIQNVSSPLSPFFKNTIGDFWTSDSVRSTKTFGYAYEIQL
jgi:tyrosinase